MIFLKNTYVSISHFSILNKCYNSLFIIGHINRPTYPYFIDECLKENVALLCLDFHGHGYSEGTMAYVEEQDHLLDDVTCLLRYVYHKDFNSHECSFNEHVSGHNNHEKEKQKKKDDPHVMTSEHEEYEHFNLIEKQVPFYLMGQSMGGAVAIRLGNYYNTLKKNVANGENIDEDAEVEVSCSGVSGSNASGDNTTTSSWFSLNFNNNPGYKKPIDKSYASCFKGVVLLAPAVSNKLPPPVVRMVFENILVPLFPSSSIPKSLSGAVDDHSTLWNSEKYIEYIAVKDKHHPISNPHALSFGDSIRFKTANTIVQMMEKVQTEIEHIDFPFIIFHDPEDKVILYKGSLMLLNNSKTSNSQKHLYALPNAKHDLFSNRLSLIVKLTLDWIKKL